MTYWLLCLTDMFLWYIVFAKVGVYWSNHRVLYAIIVISTIRSFQKKWRSVLLLVYRSVSLSVMCLPANSMCVLCALLACPRPLTEQELAFRLKIMFEKSNVLSFTCIHCRLHVRSKMQHVTNPSNRGERAAFALAQLARRRENKAIPICYKRRRALEAVFDAACSISGRRA